MAELVAGWPFERVAVLGALCRIQADSGEPWVRVSARELMRMTALDVAAVGTAIGYLEYNGVLLVHRAAGQVHHTYGLGLELRMNLELIVLGPAR